MDTLIIPIKSQYKVYFELNLEFIHLKDELKNKIVDKIEKQIVQIRKKHNEREILIKYDFYTKMSLRKELSIELFSNEVTDIELFKMLSNFRDNILNIKSLDNVVITKDEGNNFACAQLYQKILLIETKCRSIINKVSMHSKGTNWKKFITENLEQAHDKRNPTYDLNEKFLETIVDLMFTININTNKTIPSDFESRNKEELIEIIKHIEPKSFWDFAFPNINLEYKQMSQLIKIRNKVMHFKPINYGEFNDNLKNCDVILMLLNNAEKEIDFKFTDKITDALMALSDSISKIVKPVWENIEQIAKQPNNIFRKFGEIALSLKDEDIKDNNK